MDSAHWRLLQTSNGQLHLETILPTFGVFDQQMLSFRKQIKMWKCICPKDYAMFSN